MRSTLCLALLMGCGDSQAPNVAAFLGHWSATWRETVQCTDGSSGTNDGIVDDFDVTRGDSPDTIVVAARFCFHRTLTVSGSVATSDPAPPCPFDCAPGGVSGSFQLLSDELTAQPLQLPDGGASGTIEEDMVFHEIDRRAGQPTTDCTRHWTGTWKRL